MSKIEQYSILRTADDEFVTALIPGQGFRPAGSDHPNFEAIKTALAAGEDAETVARLFDTAAAVEDAFRETLSRRVSVANGRVYFDGDEVDSTLTKHILRFLEEGEDFDPLVNFFENVQANPTDHSRTQLYDWIDRNDLTITADGLIVGYKGVDRQGDGTLVSRWEGTAIVDGEVVEGHIPNEIGSVVEMPRSEVAHDPQTACSVGLHVGTYNYAESYARGAMLEVHVHPADVVSVPSDAGGEKVRVCRYEIINTIDAPYSTALRPSTETIDPVDEDDAQDDVYWENGVLKTRNAGGL